MSSILTVTLNLKVASEACLLKAFCCHMQVYHVYTIYANTSEALTISLHWQNSLFNIRGMGIFSRILGTVVYWAGVSLTFLASGYQVEVGG